MKSKFLIAIAFVIFSCSKDIPAIDEISDKNDIENHSRIKVTGTDENAVTKTTLEGTTTSWVTSSDKIGIYSPEARATSGGSAGVTNAQFTASSSGVSSPFSGNMYWGTGNHNFYSYYPYNSGYSGSSTTVPITLSAAQIQTTGNNTSHLGTSDFTVATPLTGVTAGTAGEETVVDFKFNHVFSILEFQIKRSSGSGDISEISLFGNAPLSFTGTIDITQETPASGVSYNITRTTSGNTLTLALTSAMSPTNDYSTTPKIYLMTLPESYDGYLNIGIKSDGVYKFVQKATPSGGFKRGKKYTVQIDATNATDYPGTTLPAVSITLGGGYGAVTFAPVNVGYDPDHKYGLLYQWGRNSGQGYNTTETPAYSLVAGPVTTATGNNLENRNIFYSRTSSTYDWSSPQTSTEWGNGSYDPCPPGWRIPTHLELYELWYFGATWMESSGPDNLPGGWVGTDHSTTRTSSIFIPASGRRDYSGSAMQRDTRSFVWAGSFFSTTLVRYYSIYSSGQGYSSPYRAEACAVRCIRK